MLTLPLPKTLMKLVPTSGGYDLMLRHPVSNTVLRIATIHDAPEQYGPGVTLAYAQCLAASFLLLYVVDDMLEYEQPEGWGDQRDIDEANMWRAAFRAHALAQGQTVGLDMATDTPILDNEPD